MNFAPYQDDSPELSERAFSPPPGGKSRASLEYARVKSPPPNQPKAKPQINSAPYPTANTNQSGYQAGGQPSIHDQRGQNLSAFETSLPLRLDQEAMLAYLLLPPAGGVLLLLLEYKSDYVRFHAWQSSMLFSVIFVLHLILAWSRFLSWTLFLIDLVLIGFLSLHAYRDVETLDHYEVPLFGRLANSFVDNE